MLTALLVIIYISFISLGLPDTLLGAAWPVMSGDLGMSVSYAGVLSMVTAGGTIISSLLSAKAIKRFGTGLVTAFSVMLTAVALSGFALAPGFWWLCVLGIPLGLGAGSVDAGLNNFVALHYKAKHMNWLHCFWGVGATVGPVVMSLFLARQSGWRWGFGTISIAQFLLVIALFASLPLWKKVGEKAEGEQAHKHETLKLRDSLKITGAKSAMLCFLCYCAVEATTGLWGSTFLVKVKGLPADTAAQWIALYFLGITVGRFIAGFVSMKLSNKTLIRIGLGIIGVGILLIILSFGPVFLQMGFVLIGLGCAPIFPSMLHETPSRFGKSVSQSLMGIQMASAYVGATFMPPLFGVIAENISLSLFPYFLLVMWLLMAAMAENANRIEPVKEISQTSSQ